MKMRSLKSEKSSPKIMQRVRSRENEGGGKKNTHPDREQKVNPTHQHTRSLLTVWHINPCTDCSCSQATSSKSRRRMTLFTVSSERFTALQRPLEACLCKA